MSHGKAAVECDADVILKLFGFEAESILQALVRSFAAPNHLLPPQAATDDSAVCSHHLR
jgi:hypothetical protein